MDLRKELAPYAMEVGRLNNILPAFMMAVAWLETGGGTSTLCTEAHNLFSIKGSYKGASISLPTREFLNGQWTTVQAQFRKYPSFRESCQDFCHLMIYGLSWNPTIYSRAVVGVRDLTKAVLNFGRTPFMTDPAYSGKLIGIIKSQNLEIFDTLPLTKPKPDTGSKHYLSLIDWMKDHGYKGTWAEQEQLAAKYNIANYTGTAAQNILLLKILGGI